MKRLLISTITNPGFLVMCVLCQLCYEVGKADGIELGEIRGLRLSSRVMDDVFKRVKGEKENGSVSENGEK